MKGPVALITELFSHKVAGIFLSEEEAGHALESLRKGTSLSHEQLFIVRPGENHPDADLSPERHRLIRHQIWLGCTGASLGLAVYLMLLFLGAELALYRAVATLSVLIAVGALVGILLCALAMQRPDHAQYVVVSQAALQEGKTVVAVHTLSASQLQQARHVLERLKARTVSTL
jgi:hypothetical protein